MEYRREMILRILKMRRNGLIVCILACLGLSAQESQLGMPLQIPAELSGSFAELRGNHFHAGIDFKTQQREGFPVYAVADGTLARVAVSGTGYGKVLYIRHDKGMMSVYAHLSSFVPNIEKVVKKHQYAKKSFEVDMTYPETLHFKKGDLIGYSGNSGSSGGPHLHFELRNTGGENALNPALYGYSVKDNIAPTISTFVVYPKDHLSLVEGSQKPLHIPVRCATGKCSVAQDTVRVFGQMAFGLEAIDKANGSANELGLYAFKMFVNDELKFAWKLDAVLFSQTRYINAFMDYAHYDSTGKRIQWTSHLPANRLNIYEKIDNNGTFPFLENGVQKLRFEVSDVAGNTSVLNILVRIDDEMECVEKTFPVNEIEQKRFFSYAVSNTFESDELKLTIPAKALYEPIYFDYAMETRTDSLTYSNLHHVHHSGIPLHSAYTLKIKPVQLPKNLENKALIGSWDAKENKWKAEGGTFNNGFVSLNIRKFSTFAICIDTTAPLIKPINVKNEHIPASQKEIKFQISDDFSGIRKIVASIDGKWFLMENDPKKKTLKGTIDGDLPKGEHQFQLEVSDQKNNKTLYKAKIIR